jgi:hypothetical protein
MKPFTVQVPLGKFPFAIRKTGVEEAMLTRTVGVASIWPTPVAAVAEI